MEEEREPDHTAGVLHDESLRATRFAEQMGVEILLARDDLGRELLVGGELADEGEDDGYVGRSGGADHSASLIGSPCVPSVRSAWFPSPRP